MELVDAVERLLELEDHLLSLELSPQPDCPPQEPPLLLDAIVFDDPLDTYEPIVRTATIDWPHVVSVCPIANPVCSQLHSATISLFTELRD
jgi:hypothetical protein